MKKYEVVIGVIAIAALFIAISATRTSSPESLADRVIQKGEVRIGYIVYPPLLYKDPTTGKLSGVSYDIAEAAAKKLNLATRWVEEVGWGSAIEGLKTQRYDMVGTQMWPNAQRAREAVFSLSPMNSVIYPYVRIGDARFTGNLPRLNSPEFTISVLDGEMSSFIAKEDYPNARINSLPQLASYAEVFLNVTNRKADITFVEPPAANDFLKSHPWTIERLVGAPVRTFGNSFVFARGEESMVSMWNVALRELINDGTITRTLQKYNVLADYEVTR